MNVNIVLVNKFFIISNREELNKTIGIIGRANGNPDLRVTDGDISYWHKYEAFSIKFRSRNNHYYISPYLRQEIENEYVYSFDELLNYKNKSVY